MIRIQIIDISTSTERADFELFGKLFLNLCIRIFQHFFRRKRCDSAYLVYETRVFSNVRVSYHEGDLDFQESAARTVRPINRINFKGIPRVARDSCRSSTVISRSSPSCIYHCARFSYRYVITRASCGALRTVRGTVTPLSCKSKWRKKEICQ